MAEFPFQKKADTIIPLRTMREDIATLSQRGRSPADMVAREPASLLLGQKEQLAREFASARRWRVAVIGGVIAAFMVGAGTIAFFLFFSRAPLPDEEAMRVFLPFPAVHQEEVAFRLGDREGFLSLLIQKKQRITIAQQPAFLSLRLFSLDVARTSNRQAVPTGRQASTFEVFQTLRLRPPSSLLPVFAQDMYPYILADAFVFVIPIKDPEKALEGFLAWEPFMARDFIPLLRVEAPTEPFEDRIISNVDARVSSSLSYALFGGRYAIIALSEEALRDALERLAKK